MSPIVIISLLSPLFPLIAGVKERRLTLWYYAAVCLISDLMISYCKHFTHINYYIFGAPFFLAEFLLISFAYKKKIFKNNAFFFVIVILLAASFIWRTNGLQKKDFVGVGIFYFAYIVYSLLGFYNIIRKPEERSLGKSFFFWINVAFLMYGSGAFLIFLFRDYLTLQNKEFYVLFWQYAFVSLNIIKNVCIGIAFCQHRQAS